MGSFFLTFILCLTICNFITLTKSLESGHEYENSYLKYFQKCKLKENTSESKMASLRNAIGLRNQIKINPRYSKFYLSFLVLILSGDIELNPGPTVKFPCGSCKKSVKWTQKAVCCDSCNIWFHVDCQNISSFSYQNLNNSNVSWICWHCGLPNFNSSLFHTTFDSSNYDSSNYYSPIDNLQDDSINFHPLTTSSPIKTVKAPAHKSKTNTSKFVNNLKILNINCRSVCNKSIELRNLLETTKAEIIIGTESWLNPSIQSSEIFSSNMNVFRKDRSSKGGGVFIAVSDKLIASLQTQLDTDCEIIWVKIEISGSKSSYIGAYYRPNENDLKSLENLNLSLENLKKTNSNIYLAGDFNLPGIDWELGITKHNARYKNQHDLFLDILNDHNLVQIINTPTRGQNVLDLFLSNIPSNIINHKTLPSLGDSDHEIVCIETLLRPIRNRKNNVPKPQYNKANWGLFGDHMTVFHETFLNLDTDNMSVDDLWSMFKSELSSATIKFVPHKVQGCKKLPWITKSIIRLIRKRDKLHIKIKKKGKQDLAGKYVAVKSSIKREMRKAYWNYIDSIVSYNPEQGPSETRSTNKKFWSFISSRKKDNANIPPLKSFGNTYSASADKANILNSQFKSAFSPPCPLSLKHLCNIALSKLTANNYITLEDKSNGSNVELQLKPDYAYPMPNIDVTISGIDKLLSNINPYKACGPDQIQPRVLKELHSEIAPILQIIFNKSLHSGVVPSDWKNANVAPVFKKGSKSLAENYRPISLTCICSKIMEHIVVSNIMQHADKNNILKVNQHGFRRKLSCETQLLTFIQEMHDNLQDGYQTDIILLDFAKAFDKVSHSKLLYKLDYYGINSEVLNWIKSFLMNRSQQVVVENAKSNSIPVSSGVPQGSVLGPCLFLFFINDLPDSVSSNVRLFADDTILYRKIGCENDSRLLQLDLNKLELWEKDWQMDFNSSKCQSMTISRKKNPIKTIYILHGNQLEQVSEVKYLGITITCDLRWNAHIESACSRARGVLGFLGRNLKIASSKTKELAYFSLVRPHIEYCATVWDPYTKKLINKIEMVQRRSARFVLNRWGYKDSVTEMLNILKWPTLAERRNQLRLSMFYKVHNNLVPITFDNMHPEIISSQSSGFKYKIFHSNTNAHRFSFLPKTILDWNSLPHDVVFMSSVSSFKSALLKM